MELRLIEGVRERCLEAGVPFVIENVMGARSELHEPVGLCGTTFGLEVARHRLFEFSWEVCHELRCLHTGMCLGEHARLPKRDKHGQRRRCCEGNLFGVHGTPGKKPGSAHRAATHTFLVLDINCAIRVGSTTLDKNLKTTPGLGMSMLTDASLVSIATRLAPVAVFTTLGTASTPQHVMLPVPCPVTISSTTHLIRLSQLHHQHLIIVASLIHHCPHSHCQLRDYLRHTGS